MRFSSALSPFAVILFTVSCWTLMPVGASAQDAYSIFFRSTQASAPVGGSIDVRVGLQNTPEAATGFSFGVEHDAAVLELTAQELGAAIGDALGSGSVDDRFLSINDAPANGTGVTVALILSIGDPAVAIPAGDDHEIMRLSYNVVAAEETTSTVTLTGSLGSPEVAVVIDVNGGTGKEPTSTDNTSVAVTISSGPSAFLRGDINESGRLDIIDARGILLFLFEEAEIPSAQNCLIAYNTDGSTRSATADQEDPEDVSLTDAIFLLNALFTNGAPPPAPFPACGQSASTVGEGMFCQQFNCG